jgi:MFS family permease
MEDYVAPIDSTAQASAIGEAPEIDSARVPALDWLNFFLADVRGGLGPFLAIFLMESHHWNPGRIGLLMTIAGIAGVGFQTPAGALVDAVNWKRGLIILCSLIVAAGTIGTAFLSGFWPVTIFQVLNGGADACFGPAIAAISLGLVGRAAFTHRIGRNESFNHGGNVATAVLAGVGGYLFAPVAMLWIVAILAVASIAATLFIDPRAIDNARARAAPTSMTTLLSQKASP